MWEQGLGRGGAGMEGGLSLRRSHSSLDHSKIPGFHIKLNKVFQNLLLNCCLKCHNTYTSVLPLSSLATPSSCNCNYLKI